jgi:hypothetical protein
VVIKGTEETVPGGCHATEDEADAMLAALYASEAASIEARVFGTAKKEKGKDHGPSIKEPRVYDALRRLGMPKEKAARISNAVRHKRKPKKAAAVEGMETFHPGHGNQKVHGHSDLTKSPPGRTVKQKRGSAKGAPAPWDKKSNATTPVTFAEVEPVDDEAPLPTHWRGTLAVEGLSTDDGRMFAPESLTWRDFPLPLAWQRENHPGHESAVIVARIDEMQRHGERLRGHGRFDLGSAEGKEAARMVRDGFLRGVSVDVSVDEGAMTVDEMEDGRRLTVFSAGVVLGATLCPLPAFAQASIEPWDGEGDPWAEVEPVEPAAATAATLPRPTSFAPSGNGAGPATPGGSPPVQPPQAWFEDPALDGPTPLTVLEGGRVVGHLALWDSCHTSFGEGAGQCVRPPRSAADYAYFKTGELLTEEGTRVPVGHLTVGSRHAPLRNAHGEPVSGAVALEHYEHTGWVGADVTVGEDDHGIWFSGALRPDVDGARLREFRAAPLSGDWRRIGGNLELIGALSVNVPGFPVRRMSTLVAAGQAVAYIAAPDVAAERRERGFDAVAERIASTVGLDRRSRVAALATRIGL